MIYMMSSDIGCYSYEISLIVVFYRCCYDLVIDLVQDVLILSCNLYFIIKSVFIWEKEDNKGWWIVKLLLVGWKDIIQIFDSNLQSNRLNFWYSVDHFGWRCAMPYKYSLLFFIIEFMNIYRQKSASSAFFSAISWSIFCKYSSTLLFSDNIFF